MATSNKPTRAMLAAIGEVAAESAAVDEKLRDVFGLLMESRYAQVIAAGEDTNRLVELCSRLAAYNERITDADLEVFQAICKAAQEVRPYRNALVHSTWHKVEGAGEHVAVRSRRPSGSGDMRELQHWTPNEALEIAGHYRTLSTGIDQFIERAFDQHPYGTIMSRKRNARVMAWFAKNVPGWGFEASTPDARAL